MKRFNSNIISFLKNGKIIKGQEGTKKVYKRASEFSRGLITPEEAQIILEHPEDFSEYLNWDENRIREIKRNFYNNNDPFGYEVISAINSVKDNSKNNDTIEPVDPSLLVNRDYLFAEYLGIPMNERKYPEAAENFQQSQYVPTLGGNNNERYIRFSSNEDRNKIVDIYNDLISGIKRKRLRSGKYYSTKYNGNNYEVIPGKSKSNYVVTRMADFNTNEDPYSSTLGDYTIGTGVDPEKGQYISVYDRWDLNPFYILSAYPILPRKYKSIMSNLSDASGGFGTPINFYDRIYFDDYYGVNSKPEKDSYYGGYIVPSIKKANE